MFTFEEMKDFLKGLEKRVEKIEEMVFHPNDEPETAAAPAPATENAS